MFTSLSCLVASPKTQNISIHIHWSRKKKEKKKRKYFCSLMHWKSCLPIKAINTDVTRACQPFFALALNTDRSHALEAAEFRKLRVSKTQICNL
jgi:hypothetical protein